MTSSQVQEASRAKHAYYRARQWAAQRKLRLPSVPLPQALHDVIQEWFCLVDRDCTGRLTHAELARTFAVRPCLLLHPPFRHGSVQIATSSAIA